MTSKRATFLLSVFSLAAFLVGGQTEPDRQAIHVRGQSYGDSIVLRWAPSTALLWQLGNKYGYKIERRGPGEENYRVMNTAPLKPLSLKEWKRDKDTTDVMVATAAQALLGKIRMDPRTAKSFSQKLLASDEQQNRFAFALYAAELSAPAADGLALRWVDANVKTQGRYYYRVTLFEKPREKIEVNAALTTVPLLPRFSPVAVVGVSIMENDGIIDLRWPREINDDRFTAYQIERSTNGKDFKRLNEAPFKTLTADSDTAHHIYRDRVTEYYKKYHYRVIGITSFADAGLPSDVVSGQSVDRTGPAPPQHVEARSQGEREIIIRWIDNLAPPPDHDGYFVERSGSMYGPFQTLNAKALRKDLRMFTDRNPLHGANFYAVRAVDSRGNVSRSAVTMAVAPDVTPPTQPTNLIAQIDSLGIVSLAWELGDEEDLMGYRVYRAHHREREFVQLTKSPVAGNFWQDTVPLNTLTESVFYKIAAFDFNYNPSPYSEILEVRRPDFVKPVSPVIRKISTSARKVALSFAAGSSSDIVAQTIYRRNLPNGNWQTVKVLAAADSLFEDTQVEAGNRYSYAMTATDDAGLESDKSFPLTAFVQDDGKRNSRIVLSGEYDRQLKAFKLKWELMGDAPASFVIYRSIDNSFKYLATTNGSTMSFFDRRFYRNKTGYRYIVKAIYHDGGESEPSNTLEARF